MPEGMLGRLPLSAVRGPLAALMGSLASPDGEQVLAELKKFNRRESAWSAKARATEASSLTLYAETDLVGLPELSIYECFPETTWASNDENIYRWMSGIQWRQDGCKVGTYRLAKPRTFLEMANAVLGPERVGHGEGPGLRLSRTKLTLSLSQINKLVHMQEMGINVGLQNNGWTNFAFVDSVNERVMVFVFSCIGGRWHGLLHELSSTNLWPGGRRLLLRNITAKSL